MKKISTKLDVYLVKTSLAGIQCVTQNGNKFDINNCINEKDLESACIPTFYSAGTSNAQALIGMSAAHINCPIFN